MAKVNSREQITIDLPHPPRILHPNARPHYMAKAKATKAYRMGAKAAALAAGGDSQLWPSASVKVIATYKDARRRDRDGILSSLKAAFDGLADAWVVMNDADFTYEPVEVRKGKDVGIRLIITKGVSNGEA